MGKTLMGGESSGTPMETRGGTDQYAKMLQMIMGGDAETLNRITAPFFGLQNRALTSTIGGMSLPQISADLLADPRMRTAGLFSAMQPFEDRQMQQAVAGTRNIFGSQGGRFSRGVASAEAQTRGELASQFSLAREQALLGANAQRIQALNSLLGYSSDRAKMALAPFDIYGSFFRPGAPVIQEGMLPGLLSTGATLGAMALFPPAAPAVAGLTNSPVVGDWNQAGRYA